MFTGCRQQHRRFCCPAAAVTLAVASFAAWGGVSPHSWTAPPPVAVSPGPGDIVVGADGSAPIGIGAASPGSGRLLVIHTRLAYEPPAYCG